MEARVAVLEQIAKQTSEALAGLRTDLAAFRAEVRTGSAGIRAEFAAVRDRHDRDFRLTFGVIITVALGLAALMAKGFKWF